MSRVTFCADCGASMVHTIDRYCPDCFSIRVAPSEAETVTRIVAWLRAQAKRCRDRNESWETPSTDAAVAAHTELYADAIERGDWKTDGGRDG